MKKCGVAEILMKKMWRKGNPYEKCGVKEIPMKKMWRKENPSEKNVAKRKS